MSWLAGPFLRALQASTNDVALLSRLTCVLLSVNSADENRLQSRTDLLFVRSDNSAQLRSSNGTTAWALTEVYDLVSAQHLRHPEPDRPVPRTLRRDSKELGPRGGRLVASDNRQTGCHPNS